MRRVVVALAVAGLWATAIAPAQQATSPEDQRQAAIALEQQGRNPESETAWRGLSKLQPQNPEPYAHLGFLEARQQHYAAAVPLYRKALALSPSMPGLRMNLGLALFKAGELKPAIQTFELLLKQEAPDSQEAQRLKSLIGLAMYGLQQYADAVPYLKDAAAADPQNLEFRLVLAHSCLQSKQFQCVLDVYREILNLNAESAEADILAGEALDEMNDHAGATQQFRAAVKANPREPNVHFGLGYLLWTQGQYDEAAEEFQAELANVPNHVQAILYLADANIKLHHDEVALPLVKRVIQLSPGIELAHLDLGILNANAGRRDEARQEFIRAAKLNPKDVNVHWRLARLYQAMGKKEDADAEFAKTKSLTKAADDSVASKLNSEHAKPKPAETNADSADK